MCFKIKPGESLDEFFACFHKILANLHVVFLREQEGGAPTESFIKTRKNIV
jgi:hypothetical protein